MYMKHAHGATHRNSHAIEKMSTGVKVYAPAAVSLPWPAGACGGQFLRPKPWAAEEYPRSWWDVLDAARDGG